MSLKSQVLKDRNVKRLRKILGKPIPIKMSRSYSDVMRSLRIRLTLALKSTLVALSCYRETDIRDISFHLIEFSFVNNLSYCKCAAIKIK